MVIKKVLNLIKKEVLLTNIFTVSTHCYFL